MCVTGDFLSRLKIYYKVNLSQIPTAKTQAYDKKKNI